MDKTDKENSTFEQIRLARLEKIKLDVELKELKVEEQRFKVDEMTQGHYTFREVLNAINEVICVDSKEEACIKCMTDKMIKIRKLLHIEKKPITNGE